LKKQDEHERKRIEKMKREDYRKGHQKVVQVLDPPKYKSVRFDLTERKSPE
jgi:hypothetical protein